MHATLYFMTQNFCIASAHAQLQTVGGLYARVFVGVCTYTYAIINVSPKFMYTRTALGLNHPIPGGEEVGRPVNL